MNIGIKILCALLFLALAGFVVAQIKKNKIIDAISSFFLLPVTTLFPIFYLIEELPDSKNVLLFSSLALLFIIISEFFVFFKINHFCSFISETTFLLSGLCWLRLYYSTFYIYRFSLFSLIVVAVISLIVFATMNIILQPQKFFAHIKNILNLAVLFTLNYSTIINFINEKNFSSTLLLTGSILLIVEYLFYRIQTTKPFEMNRKFEKLFRYGLILAAEICISTAGYLIIK